MPQWRKLHTKITESLDVNDMPDDFTRLLWVLLPTQLCREGRGVDNPSWVRARVFPMREDVTLKMVSTALDWFERRGMIVRYQVDGRGYFYVPTFHRYQGNTTKEAESEYPAPPEGDTANARPTPELVQSRSALDSDADADSESDAERVTPASAPAPAPRQRAKRPSRADPRTKHPAIQCIKGIMDTDKNPPAVLYDDFIRVLGETPDGPKLAQCYKAWVGRGFKANNYAWALEWYANGIPAHGPSRASPNNGHRPAPDDGVPRGKDAIAAWLAQKEGQRGE